MAMTSEIIYFDKPGPDNTDAVAEAVARRRIELGIEHVVCASGHGVTALALHRAIGDSAASIVAIPSHAGFNKKDDSPSITDEERRALEDASIEVLICAHALSGVGRSISGKFGGISHVEIIAHTLRRISEGTKVAVEVAIMAADAGLVPTDREIIAVGGTGRGADSAVVLQAAHANNFFDMEVREIICKPRQRAR